MMPCRCLGPEQRARFYHIWFALLHYVNERRHLVAPFPADPGPASVQPEESLVVRDTLWADDSLREGFLRENPAQLSSADLALVASWQHRLMGSFFSCARTQSVYRLSLRTRPSACLRCGRDHQPH